MTGAFARAAAERPFERARLVIAAVRSGSGKTTVALGSCER